VGGLALGGAGGYQDYPLCSHPGQDPSSIDFSGGTKDTADPLGAFVGNYWLTLRLDPSNSMQTPWPPSPKTSAANDTSWSPPVSFSILRQGQAWSSFKSTNYQGHLAKGSESALQLPGGAAVDLNFSGIDNNVDMSATSSSPPPKYPDSWNGTWFDATWFDPSLTAAPTPPPTPGDVTILFGPTGAVQSVSIANVPNSPFTPTHPIFLLIGKRQRIPSSITFPKFPPVAQGNPATWPNWYDVTNIWVVINPQNGLVSTGENGSVMNVAANNPATPDWTQSPDNWRQFIVTGYTGSPPTVAVPIQCRALARDVQSMGGK
jgi:hypothetical protein